MRGTMPHIPAGGLAKTSAISSDNLKGPDVQLARSELNVRVVLSPIGVTTGLALKPD